MTVNNSTGAPKNKANFMHKHEANVKRLQQRIVKAVTAGLRRHLKAFSRLEPDAGKLASPVLRGKGAGNSPRLPDGTNLRKSVSICGLEKSVWFDCRF